MSEEPEGKTVEEIEKVRADAVMEGMAGYIQKFENAVLEVVTQQGDNLCWMDVYTKFAAFIGIEFNPALLTREQHLHQCEHYIDNLLAGCPHAYKPEPLSARLQEVEKRLRTIVGAWRMYIELINSMREEAAKTHSPDELPWAGLTGAECHAKLKAAEQQLNAAANRVQRSIDGEHDAEAEYKGRDATN